MKIKTKKQLNLPQMIEWAWDNDIKKATYRSEDGLSVDFSFDGKAVIGYAFSKSDTFTVEEEIEITWDAHLDYLYVLTDAKDVHRCTNFTINTASKAIERNDLTFFTLVDNDLVKICDKGKLVE
ncbi:hypothetical protein [Staphylococcus xylosus]|uniref:hypothetical protein n=1 Tax=Staphylococcus xylosus TaxID=1288 RepID=UPI000D1EB6D7|nr:hypothetical protein [Staphylococcus xylosus]PTI27795.1 hypothetical protein BU115_03355 [Staphylococcus xylosus]